MNNKEQKVETNTEAAIDGNTVLDDVFLSFVSQDITYLTKPFKKGNTIFATDAHSLIYTSVENYDGFFVENDKTPDCSKFLVEPNCNYNIPITDLSKFKTEDEFYEVGENIKCKLCDGYGEVEWECGEYTKDDECPACDGSGYSSKTQKVPTGNKTFGIAYVKIKDVAFRIFEINRLFEAAKKLNEKIVLINKPENLSGFTFQLGKVNVMVMPCSNVDSEYVVLNIA